jgi:prepilin-type processing-associated H-X9-DG protein
MPTPSPDLPGSTRWTVAAATPRCVAEAARTSSSAVNTLDFSGTKLVNVTFVDGHSGADVIRGNDLSSDSLRGYYGNDQLFDNGGNDTLSGGENDDTLNGGAGVDVLSGGGGYDIFRYAGLSETGLGLAADTITDFNAGTATTSYDRLDFSGLGLVFSPSGTFAGGGQASIIATASGTSNTLIRIDGNGDAAVDHDIVLQSVSKLNVDAGDFLLV